MALNFTFSAFADEADPNFDLQLAALKRNRIPLLEIRGVDGKGVLDLTDAELETVCEKLAEAGIGVSAVGSPIGKIGIRDDFAPHFEKFKRAVEIAKKLGTARIRMFSFFIPQGEDPESCFDEVVRGAFRRFVAYAEENGVHCCHEKRKGHLRRHARPRAEAACGRARPALRVRPGELHPVRRRPRRELQGRSPR